MRQQQQQLRQLHLKCGQFATKPGDKNPETTPEIQSQGKALVKKKAPSLKLFNPFLFPLLLFRMNTTGR